LDAKAASVRVALRLAGELQLLVPGQPAYRCLYLTALLESAKLEAGRSKPLSVSPGTPGAIAAAAGAGAMEDVLASALEKRHTAAALGALDILQSTGSAQLLESLDGRPRPLALALCDPDQRFDSPPSPRSSLDPRQAYPGSSRLPRLSRTSPLGGARRALIGHPRTEQAQTLVGVLLEHGFQADTAQVGREVIRLAAR